MFLKQYSVLLLALLLWFPAAGMLTAQECYTPIEWMPKNYVSGLDCNRNFVDDELEQMDPTQRVKISLALNACASDDDINRFSQYGTISMRSRHLSYVSLNNVTVADAIALGADERVAMVEMQRRLTLETDVAHAAAKISSSATYSSCNLATKYKHLNGSGITIAFFDSGINNKLKSGGTWGHDCLPAWKFVAGFDATNHPQHTDPSDGSLNDHGTHVASIALGLPNSSGLYRGVAPQAKLVDIKVYDSYGPDNFADFLQSGLEVLLDSHAVWGVDVVNISVNLKGQVNRPLPSNGSDILSAKANMLVRAGMVVVGSMGNTDPAGREEVRTPAAADFIITVTNVDDKHDVDRTNDDINPKANLGPRLSDGDSVQVDEQKPDIAAYGTNVVAADGSTSNGYQSLSGTSQATPQVAGLVALILQADADMDPLSIKELLIKTAEDRGAPDWDPVYGHGIIDACAVIDTVLDGVKTDVMFNEYCHQPGNTEWWISDDIEVDDPNIEEGKSNIIRCHVKNDGPTTAFNVKVRIGIYDFSNSSKDQDICIVEIPQINVGATETITCKWIPEVSVKEPEVVHACLKAYIIYLNDDDYTNNCAQRNVNIRQPHSPAAFPISVVNTLRQDATIDIVTDPDAQQIAADGWNINISDNNFIMQAADCPKTVTIELEPVGVNYTPTMTVNVYVRGTVAQQEYQELGGVQIIADYSNPGPRPADHKVFHGLRHESIGSARLHSSPARLQVRAIDGGGDDGVRAHLGAADFWRGTLADFPVADLSDGSYLAFLPTGSVGGVPDESIAEFRITDENDHAQLSVDFLTASSATLTVEVYNGSVMVTTATCNSVTFANVWPPLENLTITPWRSSSTGVLAEVALSSTADIEVLGTPTSTMVIGDRIRVHAGPALQDVQNLSHCDILAEGPDIFEIRAEAGGTFERPYSVLGNSLLEWSQDGEELRSSRITARSAVGVKADVANLQSYDIEWQHVAFPDVPLGTELCVTARGNLLNSGNRGLGMVAVNRLVNNAVINVAMPVIGVDAIPSYTVEVYNGGNLVYSNSGFGPHIGHVGDWPNAGGHGVDAPTDYPCFKLFWPGTASFALSDNSTPSGDELRIIPESLDDELLDVCEVTVSAVGLSELRIIDETAASPAPVSVGTPEVPLPFRLYQNFPNPFAERTIFKFDLFSDAALSLELFDLRGNKVAQVFSGELGRGTHEIEWKRPDSGGKALPSGTYVYRLSVQTLGANTSFSQERKMLLLR